MTLQRKIAFLLVILAQVLVLVYMIAQREFLLQTGKTIMLEVVPIDPRSLFSGDYVILNYRISRIGEIDWKRFNRYQETFEEGDTLYFALKQKEESPFWEIKALSKDKENLIEKDSVVIRGVLNSSYYFPYRIRFGLESYFVPQGEGKEIERKIRDTTVEVAVSDSGDSAIKRLFIQNKEVNFY